MAEKNENTERNEKEEIVSKVRARKKSNSNN